MHCKVFKTTNSLTVYNSWINLFYSYMSSKAKIIKMPLKIGTHNGNFHCDEALACYMLLQLPEYKDAEIVRTRDLNILNTCDIVVDVGKVFNPSKKRFDHHQDTFNETLGTLRPEFGETNIRLSSAGLVYAFYGEKVLSYILKNQNVELNEESLRILYKHIYVNFIQEIDAIDNGVPISDGDQKYFINTDISSRVGDLNPQWNTKENVPVDQLFEKAMKLVGSELNFYIKDFAENKLPARDIVSKALKNANNVYETCEIIELQQFCPWKEHIFEIEKELNIFGRAKYVLFANTPTDWRVMCVPLEPNSFVCRKFLHKDWRGKPLEDIVELSGIKDVIFCHSTGFIGGAKSKDGALEMARQSLLADYVN